MGSAGAYNVIEATCGRRKERFVILTERSVEDIKRAHAQELPSLVKSWGEAATADYRLVEGALTLDEAQDFLERYVEVMRSTGWRTVVDAPPKYRPMPGFPLNPAG